MLYGVSYYPEHKAPEELKHDIRLIKESGINTVRMGEFAWNCWESEEGIYDTKWLDPVVEELGAAGIKTIICTPTACPPAWMVERHPDLLYMDNRRIRRPFGGRRHYCYNNEAYRQYSEKIASFIGQHYGSNPYVAGFQIDNEPAQEGTGRCSCPTCTTKFQAWLEEKYGTIEDLNTRSGGKFWAQDYTSFAQINPPVNTIEVGAQDQIRAFYENPSIRLDWERFCSDSQIAYQDIQTRALKQYTSYPVTTNATGLATNSIDYYKSTKELDCYAFDFYPGLRNAVVDSFPYAFARGVKEGKPFWVLEFMSGGGHRLSGSGRLQPNPGALKQAVLQSYAHGAEMMLHFQFRSFPFGAEQLNYAIVDMDGVPRRRYYEMQDTAAALKILEPYQKAEFANEAAVLFDYDAHWSHRIKPANDPFFHYVEYAGQFYQQLQKVGVNADVIAYDHDFSQYKMVILPAAFILTETMQEKLTRYVENGGTLVTTFLSSVKNEDNIGYTKTLPAGLTDVFGITVEEIEPIFADSHMKVRLTLDEAAYDTMDAKWSELLAGEAAMLGSYIEGYKNGHGTISQHQYGEGTAYYIGTDVDDEAMCALLAQIAAAAEICPNKVSVPDKVEVVRRVYEGKDLYYVINFSGKEAQITYTGSYTDCLSGKVYADGCSVDAYSVSVLLQS